MRTLSSLHRFLTGLLLLALGMFTSGAADSTPSAGPANSPLVFIGTYTGAKSKGIYVSRWDARTGRLSAPELAGETVNPAFLAVHPNQRVLYAASEINRFEGKPTGAVAAFAIDRATGRLTLLNQQSSGGSGPCHLSLDRSGRCALVANYGSGSVAALTVREDGSLGEAGSVIQHHGSSVDSQRQQGPHAHQIVTYADSRRAFVCDLGLDQVLVYRLDAARATLTPDAPPFVSLKPGSGPRHFAFRPDGRFAYVLSEMADTVTTFAFDAGRGTLKERQTVSTLPEDFKEVSSAAEIAVHPSGKFLYASNRGHDSIAVFSIDERTGQLRTIQWQPSLGKVPRFFGIAPAGTHLLACNQNSDSIVVFRIDAATGRLEPTGQSVSAGSPVCLAWCR